VNDRDAQALRRLVTSYGIQGVVLELLQIVRAYAQHSVKWHPVLKSLQRVYWFAGRSSGKMRGQNGA
jgi:hypothetical protein